MLHIVSNVLRIKLTTVKVSFFAMCFFASLVLVQAVNKTFFNFLQRPYLYITNTTKFADKSMLQIMLQDQKAKNLTLQKQLILNSDCKTVLKFISNTYKHIAIGVPVFFSKGNSKFIIAKIDSDNIKLNDIAIDKNDYIIGRVIDVFDNGMFKIQQIEDDRAYMPSLILGHSLGGYVNGYNGLTCNMVFETDDDFDMSKINDGDVVVTSGFDNFIPYGLNIGRIKKYKDKLCIERDVDRYISTFKIVRVIRHT